MAQLVVLFFSLALILPLTLRALSRRTPPSLPRREADPPGRLRPRLRHQAREIVCKAASRPRMERRASALLQRLLRCRDPLPALGELRENGRALLLPLLALRQKVLHAPRLPADRIGTPRMLRLSMEYVRLGGRMDAASLLSALSAWQEGAQLTLAERLSLPLCLRIALAGHLADLLENLAFDLKEARLGRLLARRLPRLRHPMAYLQSRQLSLPAVHALLTGLREGRCAALLSAMDELLEKADYSASRIAELFAQRQAEITRETARILSDLRTLDKLDWDSAEEPSDPLHLLLMEDPAGVYPRMDSDSRMLYRRRAAALAHSLASGEANLTQAVLELCAQAEPDGLRDHVGWYLLENDGLLSLGRYLHSRRGLLSVWLRAHADVLYRLGLSAASLAAGLVFLQARHPLGMLPFFLGVFSCVSHLIADKAARRLMPATPLPRMYLPRIDEEARTLIVIPAVLREKGDAVPMVRRLLLARKAFPEGAVDCLLLADFGDCLTQSASSDREIIETARMAIEAVDGDGGRYFYLHRRRYYDRDMRMYIGRERKRGALETLNRLIVHGQCEDAFDECTVPEGYFHRRYAYVLTLDSDTTPAPDALLPLAGALAHPLNERRSTPEGMRGVSILQPRMEVDSDTVHTRISLLDGGAGGVDPYGAGMGSLWQLLCGHGNFEGKGLYRPDALLEATEDWILPDTVLSHDLLEGELAGCAQDASVAFYDGHPATLMGWLKRLHRWTRGDWQLLPWLLPYVKTPGGVRRNPLSSRSRCKLRDNLRRSLIPLCQLVLMVYAAFARDGWLFLFSLLAPELGCLMPPTLRSLSRLASHLALLPLRAAVRADAVWKALWRGLIRHEKRLEWVDSAHAGNGGSLTAWSLWSQAPAAAALTLASLTGGPVWWPGLAVSAALCCFPFVQSLLDTPLRAVSRLTSDMETSLMDVCEATWRFFEETVTAQDHFLPPDNLQEKPWRGLARRTSPTNIGMYLLSCLAARELQLIGTQELCRRVDETLSTLERLSLWHGLPYNWYVTDSLAVLDPPFVSSVDCGNLCACLIALAQGLRAHLREVPAEYIPLPERADSFAAGMALARLFDFSAQLFHIGVDARTGQPTPAHYDLLASEAQLLSFVAVMRREVPLRHFARLNRALVRVGQSTPYVSWSGTAFEYLMPRLLLPVSPGTQAEHTLRAVIHAQRRAGVEGMFGISESGFWRFDEQMNYQYHAFGLPEIALGPCAPHKVIAPYACALCLPFAPREAHDSLMRLRSRGMLARLGYYESLDFDPAHLPENTQEAMVQSHMAHHQGMLLCSLCNAMTDGILTRHFMAVPSAAACALLLKEKRIPRLTLPPRLSHPENLAPREPSFRRAATPLSAPIDAHLIGGPDALLLMSAQGLGRMRSRGIDLTRFTADPTLVEGIQFYLRDTGETFRLTDPALPGDTAFSEGSIRFSRVCGQVQTTLTALTDPVRGSFLHVVELANLSPRERIVELADCLVPELLPHPSEHPAYTDLFLETARPEERVLTVTRRPREAGVRPLTLCHALSTHEPLLALSAETDRMAFQGRNRTLHSPVSLEEPMREGLIGAPITPCAAFRLRLRIPGRGKAAVIFVTRLLPEGEAFSLEALSPRLSDVDSLLALSRLLSRSITDAIPMTQARAGELSRLFGPLLWAHQPHQGAVTPLTCPPSRLQALGLDTANPLLTVMLHAAEEDGLLRDAADTVAWLRLCGQPVTLCVLCEGDHAALARTRAEEVLDASALRRRHRGSVAVWNVSDLEEGVRETIEALSRVILYEGSGSVAAQVEAMAAPLPAVPVPSADAQAPAFEPEALRFDNSLGGFQAQTDDYVLRLSPGEVTPAPWCSLLTGEHLGSLCMESGLNMTFAGNSHLRRLTPWSNDPVCPMVSEAVYLTDEGTGAVFTPTPLPLGGALRCRVQVSPGVTQWQSMGFGLDITLTASVIPGDSFGLRTLRLKNLTHRDKRLTVTLTTRFVMGQGGADEALVCLTPIENAVTAASPLMPQTGCLALCEGHAEARCMSPMGFLGPHGGVPCGLGHARAEEAGSLAVLTLTAELPAGGSAAYTWVLGACRQLDALEATLHRVRQEGASALIRQAKQQWALRLGALCVETPEDSLNLLLNRMLPWQVRASRLEARCGFYQAGGAIGFRDQLQDMTALVFTEPERVRAHLLLCARHQYVEGDVQHWWHPPLTGVRTRIADDRLFLPFMTCWYIRRTGDADILREEVPWLIGEPVPEGQDDLYTTPGVTRETDTLYTHCLRALTSIRLGKRGLPLMNGGDWNDGMNRVRGESVWLALFYMVTLKEFAAYAPEEAREEILAVRTDMMDAVERYGWDGEWYLRAWFDDGAPLGSAKSPECRIDSLSQSWAVLALGVTDRTARAMEQAWQQLYEPRLGLMRLLTPPFDGVMDAGYIAGYLPGIRENGGQYTHAAAWMLLALCELGWTDRAYALLRALNPILHADTPEGALRYRLEPYALAGDVYANPQQQGRGGWSHYTGSAAWLYTVALEKLLGLEKRGSRVRLVPRVPKDWDEVSVTLQLGASTWRLQADRETAAATCDGRMAEGGWVTLVDDGKIHQAHFPLRP